MLVVISCPGCGHLGRVPEGRIGHKIRCKGCGNTFRPDKAMAQPPPEEMPRAGRSRASKDPPSKRESEGEKTPETGLLAWLKRPTVIDGAIAGALGGILSGLVIGAITGGANAKPREMEIHPGTGEVLRRGSSGVLAGVMGGGLTGLGTGFLCGVLLGGLLGMAAEYFKIASANAWRRALFFGIVTGTCIATIIRGWDQFEIADLPWIAFGIVLGAIGGTIWSLLQTWEQAADVPFTSGFQVEEEPPPEGGKAMPDVD
jgi:hypothetical protein